MDKLIKELTTYDALAIWRPLDFVQDMKNAIWATFFQKFFENENSQNINCPECESSQCRRKLD